VKKVYDIAIIGAGASGLMLASILKRDICLIDKNSEIGAKIKVSGGGRCNITNRNISSEKYLGDKNFIKPILENFSEKELLSFCKNRNLFPKVENRSVSGSYFCKSSKDVISMFEKELKRVPKFLSREVLDVEFSKEIFTISTSLESIKAKKVVVASGGLSFPNLGASNIAFKIGEKFGHKIENLAPALVGFTVQKEQFWFKNLSGVSLQAKARIGEKELFGDILFTHKGCSGPLILNSSLYWQKGKIVLNFLPHQKLENILIGKKNISTLLPLPKKFILEFLNSVDLKDKPANKISEAELEKLKTLQNYQFSPAGNFGYSKAEVTKGGISTDEVNSQTMESKLQKNLYFLGEALNVTGELGGYNFQFAFSSAITCANLI
jgi:predicted Rossmann fold flavoprotein